MNFDKYNPLKDKVEDQSKSDTQSGAIVSGNQLLQSTKVEGTTKLQSWKDSAPVVRLSEYMKVHKDQGIKLYQVDGKPMLNFEPGLGCADMKTDRWQITKDIMALFIDAIADLKYLIEHNLINISPKPEPECACPPIDTAGPSTASAFQGSNEHDTLLHLE